MGTRVVVTGGAGPSAPIWSDVSSGRTGMLPSSHVVRREAGRLAEVADDIELFTCDVRDQDALERRSPAQRW